MSPTAEPKPTYEDIRHAQLLHLEALNFLLNVVRAACPVPENHRFVQHRDGREPWCPECRRSERGIPIEHMTRHAPGRRVRSVDA